MTPSILGWMCIRQQSPRRFGILTASWSWRLSWRRKAETMLQFIHGLRGSLHVTFEEGTSADWLYTLLKPHVTEVLVCDPRKNALLKVGNKGDRIDARKLSELLRANLLRAVFHDDTGLRTLREMARSYLTITKDFTRVMRRLKAIYRSWAIPCGGQQVYSPRHRAEWLGKITEASVRRRAELYYQQLDTLRVLHQQAKKELLAEGRKHKTMNYFASLPSAPFGRFCWLQFYKHRIGSAPRGNCGATVVWRWRHATAGNIASRAGSSSARRRPSPFVG